VCMAVCARTPLVCVDVGRMLQAGQAHGVLEIAVKPSRPMIMPA
jgi:hypothetical protein